MTSRCRLMGVFLSVLWLFGCGDSADEANLVDLHTTAAQDLISIEFSTENETTHSIESEYTFVLLGTKTNGITQKTISRDIDWSVSEGASSRISSKGVLTASSKAENITLTARVGLLSATLDVKVSSAKFDRVIELSESSLEIDMCQTMVFEPIGSYLKEDNSEEIRPVDSTVIDTIEWLIFNQEDDSDSKRAYISVTDSEVYLHALAAGDLTIQARATSQISETEITSVAFNQSIDNSMSAIKLCSADATDFDSCSIDSPSVEKDRTISFIAVGTYSDSNGGLTTQNISTNSQWSIDNDSNATAEFSSDRDQVNVTGVTEDVNVSVRAACGVIDQSIEAEVISAGVILSEDMSCSNLDCYVTRETLRIDELSVENYNVSVNSISLTDDIEIILSTRPVELEFNVDVELSNGSDLDITDDSNLIYEITLGESNIIDEVGDGVFTVLTGGLVRIRLEYRDEIFIADIRIP
jgi:hypothetical protein